MKAFFLLLIVLSTLAISQARRRSKRDDCDPATNTAPAGEFKHYVFASEWAENVCEDRKGGCSSRDGTDNKFWNIHGLWPDDERTKGYYRCCKGEQYDPEMPEGLISKIQRFWSGLYSDFDWFHDHEWRNHGTCSGENQTSYFSTVLAVAEKIALFDKLASKDQKTPIVPRREPYDCQEIVRAVQKAYDINSFKIHTDKPRNDKNADYTYVFEIRLCVERDLRAPDINPKAIDCRTGDKDDSEKCSGRVIYAPNKLNKVRTFSLTGDESFDYEVKPEDLPISSSNDDDNTRADPGSMDL